MPHWEFEAAKKELEGFWEYAHELYGPDGVLDAADKTRQEVLKAALGPEISKLLHEKWCAKKHLGVGSKFIPINRSQIPKDAVAAEDTERTAKARESEQSLGPNPT